MTFYKKTLNDVPLEGMTVLVRADYNVPLNEKGEITDDFRIRASLPTLERLLKKNCKIVIISHLGRPDGVDPKFSLLPIAQRLAELIEPAVRFVDKTSGEKVKMAVKRAPKGSITMLENLRFHPEEEANDHAFAHKIAKDSGGRYFIQDGFGVVHRDHASTSAITTCLPSVAGLLLEKEYLTITGAMEKPRRPLVAVMGGAKVSDKIKVIEKFVEKADRILIGGAMANTFLAYKHAKVGKSKVETGVDEVIEKIYQAASQKVNGEDVDSFIALPIDVAVAKNIDETSQRVVKAIGDVANDDIILDIGDATTKRYSDILQHASTVVWNGTMGVASLKNFSHGSAGVAKAMTDLNDEETIVGGGDTADFVIHWDKKRGDSFSHVSTGGGASLDLMAGKKLPGIEHLLDA